MKYVRPGVTFPEVQRWAKHVFLSQQEQSARTTITVEEEVIDSLNWLDEKQNIQPKQVLGLLIENKGNEEAMVDFCQNLESPAVSMLIKKSIVITKESLRRFNEISRRTGIKRNILISSAVLIIRNEFGKILDKQVKRYKQVGTILDKQLTSFKEAENKIRDLFAEDDDPVLRRWSTIYDYLQYLDFAVAGAQRGFPIDPNDITQV